MKEKTRALPRLSFRERLEVARDLCEELYRAPKFCNRFKDVQDGVLNVPPRRRNGEIP